MDLSNSAHPTEDLHTHVLVETATEVSEEPGCDGGHVRSRTALDGRKTVEVDVVVVKGAKQGAELRFRRGVNVVEINTGKQLARSVDLKVDWPARVELWSDD